MDKAWSWVAGILVGLVIIGFLVVGGSNQADYWIARGTVPRAIQVTRTEDITLVRFHCGERAGSIAEANECGFYVWKK